MTDRSSFIKQIAKEAGKILLSYIPSEGVVEKEGRANFATAADLASEKLIMDAIQKEFPGESILAEETSSDESNALELDHLWVIDPVDGTNNFRHERHYSAVSIGYLEKGEMKIGVVYDPFHNELFFAEKGNGAFLNEEKIHVAERPDFSHAVVATDNSYDSEGTKHNLELMIKIQPTPWALMKGSAVLMMCEIAAGRTDLYFHNYLKPWDNAAGFLIVQEAGGLLKGIDGSDITFLSPHVIMGNETLVKQCIGFFKE